MSISDALNTCRTVPPYMSSQRAAKAQKVWELLLPFMFLLSGQKQLTGTWTGLTGRGYFQILISERGS